jgi:type I restriction enzyme S subunit
MSEANRNDWVVQPLGELAEARRGITYSSAMLESQEEGLPYVNMKSFLKGGGFNTDGTKRYAGIYGQNDLVGERDLLIANTDVTAGDIVGVPALLPNELSANNVLYSHHVTRLRLTSWVTVPFLYYLLCLPEYRSHMLRIARGTTVLMLDMHAIKRIPIRAPKAKAEQDRIAEILSTLDAAIEQTKALIAKHQQIKVGLMHDLFTRGVTRDGHLRPTREQAPDLYKESPLGWIPKEWAVVSLDEHVRIIDCKHYTPEFQTEGYAFVRPRNVKVGGLEWESVDYVSAEDFRLLTDVYEPKRGDIVFSRNASFGVPCYVDTDVQFAIGQDVVIMTKKGSETRFVFYALTTPITAEQIAKVSAGSTFGRINLGEIRKLLIPRPDEEEQRRITDRLVTCDVLMQNLKIDLAKLHQKKHGLMHDLLTGHVRVKFSEKRDARG